MDEHVKAHFDVLFGSLKGYQDGLFDGAFRASGFLVLVIGWLLTSKEARAYLAENRLPRRLCAAVLAAGSIVYAAVSWRVYALSQAAFRGLVELNYLPAAAYAEHRIHGATLTLLITQNVALTLVACYFMLDTVRANRARSASAP